MAILVVAGGGLGAAGCVAEGPAGTGTVSLALEAATCADHCVVAFQAQPFRDPGDPFGLGPASEPLACGETLHLEGLAAGTQLVIRAWASDGQDNLFVGFSEPVTVAADTLVTATVQLEAIARPSVFAVEPEPVVLAEGDAAATVTVRGEGLRAGEGLAWVELAGVTLAADGWSDEAVTATVPLGARGGALRVGACGVGSEAFPVRVISPSAGLHAVTLNECASAATVDAAATPDGAILAALSCAGGGGVGLRVDLTPNDCAKDLAPWSLDGAPVAIAVAPAGDRAWVTFAAPAELRALALADGATLSTHALPGTPVTGGLAALGADAFALIADGVGATTLWRASTGAVVPGVAPGLAMRAVAAGPAALIAVAAPPTPGPGAVGRLVRLADADAGFPPEWPLPSCADPADVSVSSDGLWAAVACGGDLPGVVAFPLANGAGDARFIALGAGARPVAIALDAAGTVAFVLDASSGRLEAVDVVGARRLGGWTVGPGGATAGTLAGLGDPERLLVGGLASGAAAVLAPYQTDDPCAEASP